jgi:hypothetical protein
MFLDKVTALVWGRTRSSASIRAQVITSRQLVTLDGDKLVRSFNARVGYNVTAKIRDQCKGGFDLVARLPGGGLGWELAAPVRSLLAVVHFRLS